MKRLFALLLICLLPMQVFAGMLTYKTGIDSAALELQVQQEQQRELLQSLAHAGDDQQSLPDQADRDDDNSYADSEDFSNHAGAGAAQRRRASTAFPSSRRPSAAGLIPSLLFAANHAFRPCCGDS